MKTVARSWAILPDNRPLLSPTFCLASWKSSPRESSDIIQCSPRINIHHPNLLFFVSLFRSLHPPERETCLVKRCRGYLGFTFLFFSSAWIG